jgi:hypothetical protein
MRPTSHHIGAREASSLKCGAPVNSNLKHLLGEVFDICEVIVTKKNLDGFLVPSIELPSMFIGRDVARRGYNVTFVHPLHKSLPLSYPKLVIPHHIKIRSKS